MKKIIILIVLSMMIGCKNFENPKAPHRFIITNKQDYEDSKLSIYKVVMPDFSYLGDATFYFVDTKDKFEVGDILIFKKIK